MVVTRAYGSHDNCGGANPTVAPIYTWLNSPLSAPEIFPKASRLCCRLPLMYLNLRGNLRCQGSIPETWMQFVFSSTTLHFVPAGKIRRDFRNSITES